VVEVSRRTVTVEVEAVASPPREHAFRIEVAAPLPKGDRAQFLLEKLTELGVASFVPLQTARSIVQPRETKLDKLQRHVIEASKQCGRNVLLRVQPLSTWADYVRNDELPPARLVAHPGGPKVPSRAVEDVALAVGPEGGFTEEEIAVAQRSGWKVMGLGPRTLRMETAAIVLAVWAGNVAE
jgi:16S rRNA (uracil1498-N3)-methyltransferase